MPDRTTPLARPDLGPLERELTLLVRRARRAGRAIAAEVHPELDEGGYAVVVLLSTEGPLHAQRIAEALRLDKSTVSRQVSALCQRGLVARVEDPLDRRAALLTLSEEGRRRLAAVASGRRDVLQRTLADWPDADIRALTQLLARLGHDLDVDEHVTRQTPVTATQETTAPR